MTKLQINLYPYDKFAKLRIEQFWPPRYKVSDEDGIECRLGTGDGQMCNVVFFLWPVAAKGEVSEISLESFDEQYCPPSSVRALLDEIGLPLQPGQSYEGVVEMLGAPISSSVYMQRRRSEFAGGGPWPYTLYCGFDPHDAFECLTIVRSDRVDPDD